MNKTLAGRPCAANNFTRTSDGLAAAGLLMDGWLDGEGVAPARAGLQWFIAQWEARYPKDLPQPYCYPVPNGRIQLEWEDVAECSLWILIDLSSKRAELWVLEHSSHESMSVEIDLGTKRGWHQMRSVGQLHRDHNHVKRLA